MTWKPVNEELPKSGRHVLFCYVNEAGRGRISYGFYADKVSDTDDEGEPFLLDGWYEAGWRIDAVAEVFGVTHWCELPKFPNPEYGELNSLKTS